MLFEFTGKDCKVVLDANCDEIRTVCGSLAGLIGGNMGIINSLNIRTLPKNRIAPFFCGEPWEREDLDGECGYDEVEGNEGENNGEDLEQLFEGRIVEREMSKEEMLFIVFCHRYGLMKSPEGEEAGMDF